MKIVTAAKRQQLKQSLLQLRNQEKNMSAVQAQLNETELHSEDGLDQYLTFMLNKEEYGVDILRVQEIKGWDGVTPHAKHARLYSGCDQPTWNGSPYC